jgi:Cys-tRNA(Pro) deacylase
MRTPVTAQLDELGVDYTVKPHTQPALTAESAAAERGVRLSQIVKCMLGQTESSEVVAMLIPGDRRLKISRARKHLGASSLELIPRADVESELGLVVGAISPTQVLGRARFLMDPTVLAEELVTISSGDAMAGVELRATDLRDVLRADIVEVVSTRLDA